MDYLFEYYTEYFTDIMIEDSGLENIPPIYSLSSKFTQVNKEISKNNYLISPYSFISDNGNNLINGLKDIFNKDYTFIGLEINYLIALAFVSEAISSNEMDISLIFSTLYSQTYNTVFGSVYLGLDNVLSHEAIISKKDENNKLIYEESLYVLFYEGNVYKIKYYDIDNYGCNWKDSKVEKYIKADVTIGILLSLTGSYSVQDIPLLNTYILAVNLINQEYKGVRDLLVKPYVRDIHSNIDDAINIMKTMSNNNINYVFGLTKYLFFNQSIILIIYF